jgi:putative ABC transport system permease protein
VLDPRELESVLFTVTGVLTVVLAGVAAISLVVGGIGIMNIMLVSVTERTGVRLAVGARSGDILWQFLVEAATLAAVGGLVGIGVGVLGAYAVSHAIHVPFVMPGSAMPVAFGDPLAALRYELRCAAFRAGTTPYATPTSAET